MDGPSKREGLVLDVPGDDELVRKWSVCGQIRTNERLGIVFPSTPIRFRRYQPLTFQPLMGAQPRIR